MNAWRPLLVLALASVAALLIAEAVVRRAAPQRLERGGLAYLDATVNDLKADFSGTFSYPDYVYTMHTDRMRLRTSWSPEGAAVSVLVLGDSFAHGVGVQDDETIASMTARGLAARGISARVLNGGVPGYSPAEMLCKLRRLRRELEPDAVVLVLSFNDAFSWPLACDAGLAPPSGEAAPFGRRAPAAAVRDFVLGHSHLGVLFAHRANALLIRTGWRPGFTGTTASYDPSAYREYADVVARTPVVLAQLLAEVRAAAAEATVVYVPGVLEVDDRLWELAQRLEGGRLSRTLPREFLLDAARRAGFPRIVAPPADPAMRTLYFPLDMHLNRDGNAHVATLLVEALASGLRPGGTARP
jgi:lysophospholipase L1-like esterase